jgi:hypothetical protein
MKIIFYLVLSLATSISFSQNTISGKITDKKGNPLNGANVYLDGTYDGSTSDALGNFSFITSEKGLQNLKITLLDFESYSENIDVSNAKNKLFKLRESVNTLDAVVITAGRFEAGGKSKVSVLKPIDIVTTAGSNADIVAALQTLGGTQLSPESGRLLVRGGEADETQTYVDGLRVAQPYGASAVNTPTRGRFSPFLFTGMSFSTGGYSAEYGEALSSVLILDTQNEVDADKTELSFMTVGGGAGNTKKWKKSSISSNVSYINLAPYQAVIPQDLQFNKPFQSISGESVYRYNFENGILKIYGAFDNQTLNLNQFNLDSQKDVLFDLLNNNLYINSSFKGRFGTNWDLTTGLSYGYSQNKIGLDSDKIGNTEHAVHFKFKIKKSISDRFKLTFGADFFNTNFEENFNQATGFAFSSSYNSNISAGYVESDIFFSKRLAAKVGFRASSNSMLKEFLIAPRASLAYKLNKTSQVSFAYGDFTQAPRQDILKYTSNIESEKTTHYIFNFMYAKNNKTFRAEVYQKDYRDLVKFNTNGSQFNSVFDNSGTGYARGLDLLWRDNNSITNLEYWVSYSFIDTKRNYRNFSETTTPSFVANHTASFVTKYWIQDWKSQIGFTHSFSSGRPYTNPNQAGFMNSRTKQFNNLSFNWAYLLTSQKIIYFSMTNVLGTQNVFGYEYANNPVNGVYASRPIVPTADRFFFIGFFWTISKNKKDNQLRNL